MAYIVTPDLGLELADPATIQPFETANVNGNFLKLEAAIIGDRIPVAADLSALSSLSAASREGRLVFVDELKCVFQAIDGAWVQVTKAVVASVNARDSAYAKASSAYLVRGATVRTSDTGYEYYRDGSAWKLVSGQIYGRVTRSNAATTFPASFTNVAANTFWTPDTAQGISAYNAGWTAPVDGYYEVGYEFRASGAFLAGVSVNDAGTSPTLRLVTTPQTVQSVAGATAQGKVKLNSGDVVRPYLLASSGTPSWLQLVGHLDIELVHRL